MNLLRLRYGATNIIITGHSWAMKLEKGRDLDKNIYQATVITAMQNNDFMIGVGQYALEVDGDSSILKKYDGRNIIDVDIYN